MACFDENGNEIAFFRTAKKLNFLADLKIYTIFC
jgi:hypothetical protein